MTVGEVQNRIQMLMDDRKWTYYRLAKEAGVTTTTITDIFKRDTFPKMELINSICAAFGMTFGDFSSFDMSTSKNMPLTPQEARIVAYLRKLSAANRKAAEGYLEGLVVASENDARESLEQKLHVSKQKKSE